MRPKELTVRSLILGALITTVFTAANVYLGLKVGLTFASSIRWGVVIIVPASSHGAVTVYALVQNSCAIRSA